MLIFILLVFYFIPALFLNSVFTMKIILNADMAINNYHYYYSALFQWAVLVTITLLTSTEFPQSWEIWLPGLWESHRNEYDLNSYPKRLLCYSVSVDGFSLGASWSRSQRADAAAGHSMHQSADPKSCRQEEELHPRSGSEEYQSVGSGSLTTLQSYKKVLIMISRGGTTSSIR